MYFFFVDSLFSTPNCLGEDASISMGRHDNL